MKLKPLLLIVLFCIANSIYAQNYQLDYQFNNYVSILNRTNTYNTTLVYDVLNKVSLYTVIKLKEKAKSEKNSTSVVIEEKVIDNELIYSNFKKSEMVIQEQIDIEMMNFTEKIPTIKWELSNETKVENDYNLKKATATFRGRNYTAWYTLDIPVNVGPWKLHGLPGAIVSVNEDSGRYSWQLKEVKKIEVSTIKNPLENKTYAVKSIKEYPQLKFETPERVKEKLRKIDSNFIFPKGERIDIELLFEWENNL